MGLVLSKANSIHFAIQDSNLPNVENTLSYEENYGVFANKAYCQKFDDGDTVTVQAVTTASTVPTVEVYAPHKLTDITVPAVKQARVIDGTTYYYWEFEVAMATYSSYNYFQLKVIQLTVNWKSEKIQSLDLTDDLADGNYLKLEWTNKNNTSIVDNHLINYSTDIEFFAYVEAQIKDNGNEGEDEVFTNINEKKVLESQLFKTRDLKTDFIPEFMTDIIALAGKCFVFIINDLQYVTSGLPEYTPTKSNLKSLTWSITHVEVLGFSTNFKGLDIMGTEYIKVKNDDAITATWSFVINAGYLLHALVCGHGTGSAADYTIKVGWTVGGSDILTDLVTNVPLAGGLNKTFSIHEQKLFDTDKTVYVTLTGVGAIGKIYANLIYNTAS